MEPRSLHQLALPFEVADQPGPICSYGRPSPVDPDWQGPHHCAGCAAAVEDACRRFDADVAAGKYDTEGYTMNERKAQRKRLGR